SKATSQAGSSPRSRRGRPPRAVRAACGPGAFSLTEETPVAAHAIRYSHDAERVPQGRRLAGHHGLAEITLETLDDSGRVQPRPTDEDGVGVGRIGGAPQRVRAGLRLLVDVGHAVEAVVRDDIKAGRLPVCAACNADGVGVR